MTTATLQEKRWCGRTLLVSCDDRTYAVQYSPWGWNHESVLVNGEVVVSRNRGQRMSHEYRFWLDGVMAKLSIAMPWWAELLLRDLSFLRLEVNGAVVYEEGR